MKISVKFIQNENEIIANCPELDINCYAFSKDEAIRRIKNVITFYIESAKELGLEVETLKEISIEGREDQLTISDSISPSSLLN